MDMDSEPPQNSTRVLLSSYVLALSSQNVSEDRIGGQSMTMSSAEQACMCACVCTRIVSCFVIIRGISALSRDQPAQIHRELITTMHQGSDRAVPR